MGKNVADGKTLIASAITSKGISTSATATFSTMANNINNIKSGSNINGVEKEYYVYGGETIREGDFIKFKKGVASVGSGSIANWQFFENGTNEPLLYTMMLDDSRIFLAYNAFTRLEGIVATINGSNLTFGPKSPIIQGTTSSNNNSSLLKINSNKLISYEFRISSNSNLSIIYIDISIDNSNNITIKNNTQLNYQLPSTGYNFVSSFRGQIWNCGNKLAFISTSTQRNGPSQIAITFLSYNTSTSTFVYIKTVPIRINNEYVQLMTYNKNFDYYTYVSERCFCVIGAKTDNISSAQFRDFVLFGNIDYDRLELSDVRLLTDDYVTVLNAMYFSFAYNDIVEVGPNMILFSYYAPNSNYNSNTVFIRTLNIITGVLSASINVYSDNSNTTQGNYFQTDGKSYTATLITGNYKAVKIIVNPTTGAITKSSEIIFPAVTYNGISAPAIANIRHYGCVNGNRAIAASNLLLPGGSYKIYLLLLNSPGNNIEFLNYIYETQVSKAIDNNINGVALSNGTGGIASGNNASHRDKVKVISKVIEP